MCFSFHRSKKFREISWNFILVFMRVETNLQTPSVLGNDFMNNKLDRNFLQGLCNFWFVLDNSLCKFLHQSLYNWKGGTLKGKEHLIRSLSPRTSKMPVGIKGSA